MPFDKDAETVEATETQSDLDMNAAQAEISAELFGQDDADETVKDEAEGEGTDTSVKAPPQDKTAGESGDEAGATPAETKEGGDTSAEVQAIGAPKTWNKEELATWATIPPEVQAQLTPILERREQDFLNGITQYKAAAEVGQSYSAVVEPYRAALEAEGVDPVQLFQSFSANHYLLTKGTPEQKVQLAAGLLTGYEIPLPELLNYLADQVDAPRPDPRVAALENEVKELKSGLTARQTEESKAVGERIAAEITAFEADPAHPYFKELAQDIQRLFVAGLAKDLPSAYEMAVYANPATRQKELARLTAEGLEAAKAEEQKRRDKRATSQADHVTSIPRSKNGTVPTGSIDDTLNETMAKISSRS